MKVTCIFWELKKDKSRTICYDDVPEWISYYLPQTYAKSKTLMCGSVKELLVDALEMYSRVYSRLSDFDTNRFEKSICIRINHVIKHIEDKNLTWLEVDLVRSAVSFRINLTEYEYALHGWNITDTDMTCLRIVRQALRRVKGLHSLYCRKVDDDRERYFCSVEQLFDYFKNSFSSMNPFVSFTDKDEIPIKKDVFDFLIDEGRLIKDIYMA